MNEGIAIGKDLVILVPDKQMEFALRGILSRHRALGIKEISVDFYRHPERDSGCYSKAEDFLRPFHSDYQYALVIFDRWGSGQHQCPVDELERELEARLHRAGWGDRARCVVIEPELEIWVWSDSPHVENCLGWEGKSPDLRSWLRQRKLLKEEDVKPTDPQRAMEEALQEVGLPRSSSIFEKLAKSVSLKRCQDHSFQRLCDILQGWFTEEAR